MWELRTTRGRPPARARRLKRVSLTSWRCVANPRRVSSSSRNCATASSLSLGDGMSMRRQARAMGSRGIGGGFYRKEKRAPAQPGAPSASERSSSFRSLLDRQHDVLERLVRAAGGHERSVRDRLDAESVAVRDIDVGQENEAVGGDGRVIDPERATRGEGVRAADAADHAGLARFALVALRTLRTLRTGRTLRAPDSVGALRSVGTLGSVGTLVAFVALRALE